MPQQLCYNHVQLCVCELLPYAALRADGEALAHVEIIFVER